MFGLTDLERSALGVMAEVLLKVGWWYAGYCHQKLSTGNNKKRERSAHKD